MTSLWVFLLPLLCHGASVHYEDQWGVATSTPGSEGSCPGGGDSTCAVMKDTVELLQAAATAFECPECNCDTGEAEETCVAYLAGVLRRCRDQAHQGDCLGKELASGFPADMVPCSTDAAVCTAIHHFTKTVAKTVKLVCPPPTNTGRQRRSARVVCAPGNKCGNGQGICGEDADCKIVNGVQLRCETDNCSGSEYDADDLCCG